MDPGKSRLPKRCPSCGKMNKATAEVCRCGHHLSEMAVLVCFNGKPHLFRRIKAAAALRNVTPGEMVMGYMALGIKGLMEGGRKDHARF